METGKEPRRDAPAAGDDVTAALVTATIEEARNLVRIEIALARDEALTELRHARTAALALLVCAACVVVAIATVISAMVASAGYVAGLVAIAALLVVAAIAGGVAYRGLPRDPLAKTRERLTRDTRTIRETLS